MTPKPIRDADSQFYTLDELTALSIEELQALWDSVPSEDQAYCVRVFEREANTRQIVEDIDESRMARAFLRQYQQMAFVPAGEVWVKVPASVRDQYKQPLTDTPETDEPTAGSDGTPKKIVKKRAFPRWLFLMVIPFGCLLIFALMRLASGGSNRPKRQPTPTITPSPTPTLTPTLTPTPLPPTSTPFALSGFDEAIVEGDRASRAYYPVQLQVFPDRATPPRVFIVQQQVVSVAEWTYDLNPDVVSWLRGMIVRPVLGVPFSAANQELFRNLSADSVFVVTMNTGDVWQFVYQETQRVARTDTSLFRQDAPGLALVLIGETFADGSPTDLRLVVRATYPVDQELGGLSQRAPSVVPENTAHLLGDLSVTVEGAQLLVGEGLPADMAYAVVDIQMVSGDQDLMNANLIWLLEITTLPGERYTPVALPQAGRCAPVPDVLTANTATCASLSFLVSRHATEARLWAGLSPSELTAFQVALDPLPEVVQPSQLDVQLEHVMYTEQTLTVTARVFNPTTSDIPLTPQDFGLILGFVPHPTGITLMPVFPTEVLEAGAARDLTLEYPYAGEGYAIMTLLGRTWAVQIKR